MITYEKLIEKFNSQIRNAYNNNINIYKSLAIDYEDLKQEIYLYIWLLYEKNKNKIDEKSLLKYTNNAIKWALTNSRRPAYSKQTPQILNVSLQSQFFALSGNLNPPEILIDSLRPHLTRKENLLLNYIFIDGYTFREISTFLHCSVDTIYRQYRKLLSKIRKKIKK